MHTPATNKNWGKRLNIQEYIFSAKSRRENLREIGGRLKILWTKVLGEKLKKKGKTKKKWRRISSARLRFNLVTRRIFFGDKKDIHNEDTQIGEMISRESRIIHMLFLLRSVWTLQYMVLLKHTQVIQSSIHRLQMIFAIRVNTYKKAGKIKIILGKF